MITHKKSVHPIKKIKEYQGEFKKSSASLDPIVYQDITDLGEKDSKLLVEGLRNTFMMSQSEVESVQEEKNNVEKEYQRIEKELKNAIDERERFKELYLIEIRKKNDVKSYIFNQKMKKTMSFTAKTRFF